MTDIGKQRISTRVNGSSGQSLGIFVSRSFFWFECESSCGGAVFSSSTLSGSELPPGFLISLSLNLPVAGHLPVGVLFSFSNCQVLRNAS